MRNQVKVLLFLSLITADIELVVMVNLNGMLPIGFDYFVLLFYLYVPYAALSIVALLIWRISLKSMGISPSDPAILRVLVPVSVWLFALDLEVGLFKMYYFENPPGSRESVCLFFGPLFLVITILCLLSFLYRNRLSSGFRKRGLTVTRTALVITCCTFFTFMYQSLSRSGEKKNSAPAPKGPGVRHGVADTGEEVPRILLLGIDGLSFESIERLSAEGRLPNLRAILETGSWGYLHTVMPTLSPMLWTSISTGKVESKHGIHDFRTVAFPGVRAFQTDLVRIRFASLLKHYLLRNEIIPGRFFTYHHYVSTMRRCKSLWNILSESGVEVGVIGWYASWPAEPVNGFMVSDRSFLYSDSYENHDPQLTYPENLFPEVFKYNLSPHDVSEESLAWLCEPPVIGVKGWREGCMELLSRYFSTIQKNYILDASTLGVTRYMLEKYLSWNVLMVYFRAVDSMNHIVHHQIYEERDSRGDSLYIISDNYYDLVDGFIGQLTENRGENTILMIVSDHGWQRRYGHPYAPEGVFIMNGKHVKRGYRAEGVSIYDIAPTILYLQGLPVALDMDGDPALSCLTPAFTGSHPVTTISTYEESDMPRQLKTLNSKVDKAIEEQLKVLGYIK